MYLKLMSVARSQWHAGRILERIPKLKYGGWNRDQLQPLESTLSGKQDNPFHRFPKHMNPRNRSGNIKNWARKLDGVKEQKANGLNLAADHV